MVDKEKSNDTSKATKGKSTDVALKGKGAEAAAPRGKTIEVVNIVVSTSLEHDIPLEKMAATLSNTEYNPEQFPGLVIRIRDPKTSALIFSSGKVVCTGARSMEKVEQSIDKIIKSLKKIGIDITIKPKISIQNIVASGSVGMDLNLNVLAMKLENTEYEPEQFPGLVYKLDEAKATFLLFSNGKIVCTGTKSEEEVHKALDKLIVKLKRVS
ncbi:MAG: TATA-box-binding protein [Nanoarchaeota archaeon]|nr:TATA-box-binding protein [Nanoarchaeota archaeon]